MTVNPSSSISFCSKCLLFILLMFSWSMFHYDVCSSREELLEKEDEDENVLHLGKGSCGSQTQKLLYWSKSIYLREKYNNVLLIISQAICLAKTVVKIKHLNILRPSYFRTLGSFLKKIKIKMRSSQKQKNLEMIRMTIIMKIIGNSEELFYNYIFSSTCETGNMPYHKTLYHSFGVRKSAPSGGQRLNCNLNIIISHKNKNMGVHYFNVQPIIISIKWKIL